MTDTCGGCGDARHRLDLCAGCVQGLRDERDTARAEVERLTRDCADLSEMVSEVAAQRDEARAEVAKLRAALRGVAAALGNLGGQVEAAGLLALVDPN